MHHRASRARRTVLSVAVPVGLVMSLAVTWGSTHAAFSASTGNTGNTWETGSVTLTDGARGAALFTGPGDSTLRPGSTRSSCIQIDYTGDLTADIRMYAGTPPDGATSLDRYLVMTVERGVDAPALGTVTADCAGFTSNPTRTFLYNTLQADGTPADPSLTLADLKTTHRDFGSGLVVSAGTATDTHLTLRITYVVKNENGAQGTQSSATFTWEAQNTP